MSCCCCCCFCCCSHFHQWLFYFGFFWIKLDQTWSNLIKLDFSQIKKCFSKKFSHLQKELKYLFDFGLFWIRSVQNGSNLIKLDQTWSNWISHKSKNVSLKSFHIYKKNKNACLILEFFGSDLFKMDQTRSNSIKLDQVGFFT